MCLWCVSVLRCSQRRDDSKRWKLRRTISQLIFYLYRRTLADTLFLRVAIPSDGIRNCKIVMTLWVQDCYVFAVCSIIASQLHIANGVHLDENSDARRTNIMFNLSRSLSVCLLTLEKSSARLVSKFVKFVRCLEWFDRCAATANLIIKICDTKKKYEKGKDKNIN